MYREARSCCQPSSVSADAGAGGAEAGADDKRALGDDEAEEPLDRTTTGACVADALATVDGCCCCA